MTERQTVQNKTFENETVALDEHDYEDCVFTNCEYTYSGGTEISLVRCKLKGGRFCFKDDCARAIQILSHWYKRPELREMVEMTFENIRNGSYLDEDEEN